MSPVTPGNSTAFVCAMIRTNMFGRGRLRALEAIRTGLFDLVQTNFPTEVSTPLPPVNTHTLSLSNLT